MPAAGLAIPLVAHFFTGPGFVRAQAINVSTTSATSAQLDLPQRGLESVVRASVHYVTTDAELDRFVGQISLIASGRAS